MVRTWRCPKAGIGRGVTGATGEVASGKGCDQVVGARLMTRRDEAVLRWIGEEYVVPRDVLGVLLGRASDDELARAAGRVTDTVIDRTLRRWRDLGFAHSRRILVCEPSSVWPTTTGMGVAGLGYRASEPSFATVAPPSRRGARSRRDRGS